MILAYLIIALLFAASLGFKEDRPSGEAMLFILTVSAVWPLAAAVILGGGINSLLTYIKGKFA